MIISSWRESQFLCRAFDGHFLRLRAAAPYDLINFRTGLERQALVRLFLHGPI